MYFPFFLDIRGKRCLVVGGGSVALRKVQLLLKHGAIVTVVAPVLCSELNELAEAQKIHVLPREFEPGDLQDALIVVAATSESKINEKIALEAKRHKIMINVVDSPELSDFIVPSYFHRGDLIVAVSTSGKSPALARKIRSDLEKSLGEEYSSLTRLVGEVRQEMKRRSVVIHADEWQKCLGIEMFLKLLRAGKRSEAREMLVNCLEKYSLKTK